jgi:tetratricopeptide (TPR) repeat protein
VGSYGAGAPGGSPYGASPAGASAPALSPAQQQALAAFEGARDAFRNGDYRRALATTDQALAQMPNDSVMHEFRALCLFAMRDYRQAAAAVYAVISVGPGWDWTTLCNLYPDVSTYSGQLRALESYCEQNPRTADARFLLAYHYMLGGHNPEAANLLKEVVQLQPNDQLSAQLLKGLTTPPDQQPPAAPPTTPAAPVAESSLIGDWRASRPDGSNFQLSLSNDKKFVWRFRQQDKQQEITGRYTLANNFLILSASDQNALVGQVALEADNRLKFKLTGGNPAEPGITFMR